MELMVFRKLPKQKVQGESGVGSADEALLSLEMAGGEPTCDAESYAL
jgi:hypothetical protein